MGLEILPVYKNTPGAVSGNCSKCYVEEVEGNHSLTSCTLLSLFSNDDKKCNASQALTDAGPGRTDYYLVQIGGLSRFMEGIGEKWWSGLKSG